MFKFGFSSEDVEVKTDCNTKNFEWIPSQEIEPEEVIFAENIKSSNIQCGEINIKYISDKDIIQMIQNTESDNSILNAEQNHSDLLTGIYEGGLKIWECTFDLLHYLNEENVELNGKKVLDLGCGAGIIGIFACLKGSNTVFQDYNKEVIKSATIPNVILNQINLSKCKFYCGDWKSFSDLQENKNEKFDVIFTSETIYNVDNYRKIINIFKHLLNKSGTIYLAAKCHYFGVGGGISQFQDMLRKEDIFYHKICWNCSNGVKRSILKITLRS